MKESGTEELFELVRKAPTELSSNQVMEMISILPTLPPPANTWFNINLNSIIMTTTVITVITSAVIYLSSPGNDPQLPGQEPVDSQTSTSAIKQEEKPAPEKQDSTLVIQALPVEEKNTSQVAESTPKEEEKPKPVVNTQKPARVAVPSPARPQPIVQEEKASQPGPSAIPQMVDSASKTVPVAKAEKEEPPKAPAYMLIDDLRLKRLKRTLLRELSADKLIKSKRRYNLLEFKRGEIFVNNQRMDYEQYTKYSELLYKFRIKPAPDMRVVTSLRSIMVGRFTNAGFKGSAQGRDMEIQFVENEIEGLLSSGTTHNTDNKEGLFQEKGTDQNDQNDQKLLTNTEVKTTGTVSGTTLLSGQDTSTSQNTTTGSATEVNSSPPPISPPTKGETVDLDSKQIKAFKKELYKYLVADDQIASKRADVVMRIGPEPFSVNNNRPMQGEMQTSYETLLKKYNIEPARNRKVLMSLDFIMVGDFEKNEFTGSLQGRIDESTLAGSIFQQELEGYSIFKANTAVDIDLDTDMDIDVDLDNDVSTDIEVDLDPETDVDIDVDADPDIDIDLDAEVDYTFKKEEREIAEFQRLHVSGLAVVHFTHGPHTKARLRVGGMPIEDVITKSENGTLRVYTRRNNVSGESIEVFVSSPNITSIEVDGAGEIFGVNHIQTEKLKVVSNGSGSLELAVDVERLHLEMAGGDIDIEGRANMEKVDLLRNSDMGTLDQASLEISANWTQEGVDTWKQKGLEPLKELLIDKLIEGEFMENRRDGIAIRFFDDLLEIGRYRLRGDELKEYLALFKTYGIELRNQRSLYVSHDFLILADRNNGIFELEIQGTDLEFNVEDSWQELEEAILENH